MLKLVPLVKNDDIEIKFENFYKTVFGFSGGVKKFFYEFEKGKINFYLDCKNQIKNDLKELLIGSITGVEILEVVEIKKKFGKEFKIGFSNCNLNKIFGFRDFDNSIKGENDYLNSLLSLLARKSEKLNGSVRFEIGFDSFSRIYNVNVLKNSKGEVKSGFRLKSFYLLQKFSKFFARLINFVFEKIFFEQRTDKKNSIKIGENLFYGWIKLRFERGEKLKNIKDFCAAINGVLSMFNSDNNGLKFKICFSSGIGLFSTEELATLFRLPGNLNGLNCEFVSSKKLDVSEQMRFFTRQIQGVKLGIGKYRDEKIEVRIGNEDRRRHLYIVGKTGMGKTTLLENMIYEDIEQGKGVAVIDPHGDLADKVLRLIPSFRTNDVVLIDPSDEKFPVSFNVLQNKNVSRNNLICSGVVATFKKMFGFSWGPRLEYILRNTILSILEFGNGSLLMITRVLTDVQFRKYLIGKLKDPVLINFWQKEFEIMDQRAKIEAVSPILNKVGQLLSVPICRNILGQSKNLIEIGNLMNESKIMIVNLSKGKIGEDVSNLLGALIITKFQIEAMERAFIAEEKRKDFYLYVDEFQNFATDAFANILSEARKYRLNLILANQYIAQMPVEVNKAVFGNVGNLVAFNVGYEDAKVLMMQFGRQVSEEDLVGIRKYDAFAKILFDGVPTRVFSFSTLPPKIVDGDKRVNLIRKISRERYANSVEKVEEKLRRWMGSVVKFN